MIVNICVYVSYEGTAMRGHFGLKKPAISYDTNLIFALHTSNYLLTLSQNLLLYDFYL